MQHEPHVGLVNAHAKGIRRHNDRRGVVDEVILIFAACFGGQARVVLCGRKAVFGQKLLQLVHILAGGAVDDAALAGVVVVTAAPVAGSRSMRLTYTPGSSSR